MVPIREESMKYVSSTTKEKDKTSGYKLQFDIEVARNLKMVVENRIILEEVGGIIKQKINEVIIDIIKRKRQTMCEATTSNEYGQE